jgi:hypothetical protein
MHSMLGLGASHLAMTAPDSSELASRGLTHRVTAINKLNAVLSTPAQDRAEADARFATFMVLVFQSACLPDGLLDFITILRGCVMQGDNTKPGSFFTHFREQEHLLTMEQKFNDIVIEPLDITILTGATNSLKQLESYCRPGVELEFHAMLVNSVQAAHISPKFGMKKLISV